MARMRAVDAAAVMRKEGVSTVFGVPGAAINPLYSAMRQFQPGFRIGLHQKDLNLALTAARQLGVSLPNTATAQALFNACAAHGGGAWDHSAMVRALEKLANHEIGPASVARDMPQRANPHRGQ